MFAFDCCEQELKSWAISNFNPRYLFDSFLTKSNSTQSLRMEIWAMKQTPCTFSSRTWGCFGNKRKLQVASVKQVSMTFHEFGNFHVFLYMNVLEKNSSIGYLSIKPMVTRKRLLDTCGPSVIFGHSIFSWFGESLGFFSFISSTSKTQKSNHCFQVSKPLPQARKNYSDTHKVPATNICNTNICKIRQFSRLQNSYFWWISFLLSLKLPDQNASWVPVLQRRSTFPCGGNPLSSVWHAAEPAVLATCPEMVRKLEGFVIRCLCWLKTKIGVGTFR